MAGENLSGNKYNRWEVIEKSFNKAGNQYWLCRCECGAEKSILVYNLLNGRSKSCGCLRQEKSGDRKLTHGHSANRKLTQEYKAWLSMKSRCNDENHKHYKDYGGRGIKVCERWGSFSIFYEDMGDKPSVKHSLDRIDVNGNYEPGNCKWSNQYDQARNKRVRHDSSTGVKGVSIERNKYRVTIQAKGIRYNIGLFDSVEEAGNARIEAEKIYWGKTSI